MKIKKRVKIYFSPKSNYKRTIKTPKYNKNKNKNNKKLKIAFLYDDYVTIKRHKILYEYKYYLYHLTLFGTIILNGIIEQTKTTQRHSILYTIAQEDMDYFIL